MSIDEGGKMRGEGERGREELCVPLPMHYF